MHIFKNLHIIIKILLYITSVTGFFNSGKFIKKFTVIVCYGLYAAGKNASFSAGNFLNILIF